MLVLAVAAGALAAGALAFWRPNLVLSLPDEATRVAAVAGAAALALSDAAPTGWSVLDLLLRVALGAAVPLAAARSGVLVTGWLAAAATVVLGLSEVTAMLAAGAALGVVLALVVAGMVSGPALAAVAAASLGALGHADWDLATGASSVATAVATLPVLVAGTRHSSPRVRRWVGAGARVAAVVVVVGGAVGLASALLARAEVDDAVALALDGVDLLGDEDERARDRLNEAADRFDDARATMDAWWARPARMVPVVAQQARAVATMASAGSDLTRTAAQASEDADLEAIRPVDGRIDLDALADLVEPLDRSLASLENADADLDRSRSPLLLPLVAGRLDDLSSEVAAALRSTRIAVQAIDLLPEMLGADGPRRYLLAFQQPSETRGNGGFVGTWGELVAQGGELELTRSGPIRELSDVGPAPDERRIVGEEEFVALYSQRPARYLGNVSFSPDHPTVGRIYAQLYPDAAGGELDGVVALTPSSFAAFLELTGPIEVEGYPERLTSENAARILLHDNYVEFPKEREDEREDFLVEAVDTLFDELTSGELSGPTVIARELGPSVEAEHLQFWAADPEVQALFETIGADGSAQRRPGEASFGAIGQNYGGNKIDWFLRREISYEAAWDPGTGALEGTLSVELENRAPTSGLPQSVIGWGGDVSAGHTPVEDGENLMLLTLYATHPIESVTVDGEPVDFGATVELGHHTARFYVSVPSGATRRVVAEGTGRVEAGRELVVRPVRQVMPFPDELEARVSPVSGWELENRGDRTAVMATTAEEDARLVVSAARSREGFAGLVDRLRSGG